MNYSPYLILLTILIVALFFIFKKSKAALVKLSNVDLQLLNEHVDFYIHLDRDKKLIFEQKIVTFLSTVKIEGVGLVVTA